MTRRNRLEIIAQRAPSPTMREFARVAVARRMTLSALAVALNARGRTKYSASSVSRHLLGPYPLVHTIESYAVVLGVRRRHLALLREDELQAAELADALAAPIEALARCSRCFRGDTVNLATAAVLETLLDDPDAAQRLARAFALAKIREDMNLMDDRAAAHPHLASIAGPALAAFADCLRARLDLFEYLVDMQRPIRFPRTTPRKPSERPAAAWKAPREVPAYG